MLGVLQGVEVALKSQKDITVGEALAPAVAGILLGYPVTYILREKGLTHCICSLCRIIGMTSACWDGTRPQMVEWWGIV